MKINIARFAKQLERMATDNSPLILTGLGCIGVVTTSVLAVQAGMSAEKTVENARAVASMKREAADPPVVFTRKEKFEMTWKLYLLPVCSAALTVGCVIGAQKINARRAATLAGVLALTQDDLRTYKDKVREKMTGPKAKEVDDEIAESKGRRAIANSEVVNIPEGDVLCVEAYTGRTFASSRNKIERAENDLNRRMLNGMGEAASLSEFYDLLGLPHTDPSDEYGWNTVTPLEIKFTSMLTDDRKPALVMSYEEPPFFRSWEEGSFAGGNRR